MMPIAADVKSRERLLRVWNVINTGTKSHGVSRRDAFPCPKYMKKRRRVEKSQTRSIFRGLAFPDRACNHYMAKHKQCQHTGLPKSARKLQCYLSNSKWNRLRRAIFPVRQEFVAFRRGGRFLTPCSDVGYQHGATSVQGMTCAHCIIRQKTRLYLYNFAQRQIYLYT